MPDRPLTSAKTPRAERTAPLRCFVEVLTGPSRGALLELGDRLVLGRSWGSPIWFGDETLSRHHAALQRMPDGGYLLKDLSSANGTFVNGEQVHRRVLNSGDTIALASSTQLRFLSRASTPEQSSDRLLDLGRLVQSLAPMLAGPEPPRYALDLLVRAAQAASPQHELLPIACLRPRLERIVLDATEPVTAEFAGFDLQGSTYALVAVAIERAVQHVAAAAEHPTALGLRMTEDSATKDAPHRQAHLLLQPENGTGLPEAITPPPSSESAPTVPPDLALPLAASWAQVVGVGGSMHCDASSLSISFPLL